MGFLQLRPAPSSAAPAQQQVARASAAALQQLVALLAAHEPDLKDLLLGLCQRRHVAAHKDALGPHPEGPMATFTVTVPEGTAEIDMRGFGNCEGLSQVTLPPSLTAIGDSAFFCCTSLAKITLPPVTRIKTTPFRVHGACSHEHVSTLQ